MVQSYVVLVLCSLIELVLCGLIVIMSDSETDFAVPVAAD